MRSKLLAMCAGLGVVGSPAYAEPIDMLACMEEDAELRAALIEQLAPSVDLRNLDLPKSFEPALTARAEACAAQAGADPALAEEAGKHYLAGVVVAAAAQRYPGAGAAFYRFMKDTDPAVRSRLFSQFMGHDEREREGRKLTEAEKHFARSTLFGPPVSVPREDATTLGIMIGFEAERGEIEARLQSPAANGTPGS